MLNNDIICFIINFLNFKKMPKTQTNNSMVRIKITKKLRMMLDYLKKHKFPLLTDAEIIKVVFSEYYMNFKKNKSSNFIKK